MKRLLCWIIVVALILPMSCMAEATDGQQQITILYTHDMHSTFLPRLDGSGHLVGGYARLKTLIDQQRQAHPDALLVDAGDFSMGSLFQTAYSTAALELRAMGQMGYDATTFGNHEFDYQAQGLSDMLRAAMSSGDPLPTIVDSNYLPPQEDTDTWDAIRSYGVKDYLLLERGGIVYALFGINGYDSNRCAPQSGMVLQDPVKTAKRVVEAATKESKDRYGQEPVVICLSHSGTKNRKGEDYQLARAVDGIDVIISGHSHTTLEEPIEVNNTYIVSAGEYTKNLGVLTLTKTQDGVTLQSNQLIPVGEDVPEDPTMAQWIGQAKAQVEEDYLAQFGLKFDQVLVHNPYKFETVEEVYATQHESPLGNLLSDSYYWAATQADSVPVDVALTASGVIRDTVPQGAVTVSQAFDVASLGIGADGLAGYPLISVYLTGKDLKNVLEVDASVPPIMREAQLFISGMKYSFNKNRMIFDKVDAAELVREGGKTEPIVEDQLYRVVTGMYIGQMLGAVEESSFGILKVTPRDAQGNPIDMNHLENYILRDRQGKEVKEWQAVSSYLQSMGGEMDRRYGQIDGRKLVYASWNPVSLLKDAGLPTLLAGLLLVILVSGIALVVYVVRKRVMRHRHNS